MVIISYLTYDEFLDLGFELDDGGTFQPMLNRATLAIDLFIGHFYDYHDFETDFPQRKNAVKLATAYQISYLDSSGAMTADDRMAMASMSLGRTSVSYQGGSGGNSVAKGYNLSQDAFNVLKSAGFGYRGVGYDR